MLLSDVLRRMIKIGHLDLIDAGGNLHRFGVPGEQPSASIRLHDRALYWKLLLNPDGSLGARNDARAHSIEHKLGIHGSPTCTMVYGDNGGATAFLVGATVVAVTNQQSSPVADIAAMRPYSVAAGRACGCPAYLGVAGLARAILRGTGFPVIEAHAPARDAVWRSAHAGRSAHVPAGSARKV